MSSSWRRLGLLMAVRKFLIGLLAAVIPICAAQASPVTFTFSGVIDNDPFGVFGDATFAGSFTFDSGMTQVLNTANSGGYAGSGGIFNMTLSFIGTPDPSVVGPHIANMLNITLNNDFPGRLDQYLVTGTSSIDSLLSIELRLEDSIGTAFSNTLLPLTAPDLAAFTYLSFALFDGTLDNPIEAQGVLRTLQCTAGCVRTLPEPSPMLLLGAALGALGLVRRIADARASTTTRSVRHSTLQTAVVRARSFHLPMGRRSCARVCI
jgi:hypothetical protein